MKYLLLYAYENLEGLLEKGFEFFNSQKEMEISILDKQEYLTNFHVQHKLIINDQNHID